MPEPATSWEFPIMWAGRLLFFYFATFATFSLNWNLQPKESINKNLKEIESNQKIKAICGKLNRNT